MLPDLARRLLSDEGTTAMVAAAQEADPTSLAAAARLRRRFDADLVAAAVGQVELRRRGRAKFGEQADGLFFTPAGLEQATRARVAQWRAGRLARAGVSRVVDLGCGIGADALAFADAGLEVIAVERDEATALLAGRNLRGCAEVVCADAESFPIPPDAAVYLDPARRNGAGRIWGTQGLSPSWQFTLGTLRTHGGCAKVGPGIAHRDIPDGCWAEWVSDRGDVVECGLWFDGESGMSATLVQTAVNSDIQTPPGGSAREFPAVCTITRLVQTDELPPSVTGFRRYVAEPDGAALRAGCLGQLAHGVGATLVGEKLAYLTADQPTASPWLTWFEVCDVVPYDPKALRRYLADHDIGTLEIKKRGVELDPATLRRTLNPRGRNSATLLISPTPDGVRVGIGRRVTVAAPSLGTRLD